MGRYSVPLADLLLSSSPQAWRKKRGYCCNNDNCRRRACNALAAQLSEERCGQSRFLFCQWIDEMKLTEDFEIVDATKLFWRYFERGHKARGYCNSSTRPKAAAKAWVFGVSFAVYARSRTSMLECSLRYNPVYAATRFQIYSTCC